ncbi:DUF3419 family protein [Croceicoccus bisphenolivorans]|uniref:DUF3419 family protein n=1 Tax=Croceicoccus bisphenolivorans TaxID=1783232 RepID=UPI0009ED75CF|nr:DUF3419 family protein [Croceicoccus bisphenolivorans]
MSIESTVAPARGTLVEAAAVSAASGKEALLERAFAFLFRGLVYPQIWEDPVADIAGLDIGPDDRIVTIASGGCNALSYLTADPAQVMAVDLNAAHVALNRLKHAAVLYLPDYEHFHAFFAGANTRANVAAYHAYLAPRLDDATRGYWESRDLSGRRRIHHFGRNFYRQGLLGTFIGLAHFLARIHGEDPRRLLEARDIAEQRHLFETRVLPLFDRPLVRWLTGQKASLFGLGIPPAQYAKLSGGRAMADVLRERLEKLTCDFAFADNYFAWQAFSRGYEPADKASLPPYLQRENHAALKERIARISVQQANMTDFLGAQDAQGIDCYLFLDAQDWMTDAQLNALWSQVCRTARPGARVLFRTAAEPSLLPGRLDPALLALWDYQEDRSRELSAQDRSAIYGATHLYVRRG